MSAWMVTRYKSQVRDGNCNAREAGLMETGRISRPRCVTDGSGSGEHDLQNSKPANSQHIPVRTGTLAHKMKLLTVLVIVMMLGTSGCIKQSTVPRPGSISQFDSRAYDSLSLIQTAIDEATKVQAQYPAIAPALTKAKLAFNLALRQYKAYHCTPNADVPGCEGVTIIPVDITTLDGQIALLLSMAADILKQIGKTL